MLTPEELETVAETMQPILDELNAWIMSDIMRRVMVRLGRGEDAVLSATDAWQVQLYKDAGGHYEALYQQLQAFWSASDAEIKTIFEDAGIKAWRNDSALYVLQGVSSGETTLSERMVDVLTDSYTRTRGEVRNFTRTTAEASQERLITVLDAAHMKVITGAQSYTAAVMEAVNDLATVQTKVRYPTGHIDTIETAVLRAVRTGTGQAAGNMAIVGMEEQNYDLIRVSAHLGARYGDGGENPGNHAWWQGKLYTRTGANKDYPPFAATTGYGTGEGLCGWNCRHSFGPGDPNHNPYGEIDSEENKRIYDLSQKQRAAERRIRADKLEVLGYQTALETCEDDALKTEIMTKHAQAAARLQKHNKLYNAFCGENDVKPYSERLKVAKWTRSTATKATAAARKARANGEN